MYCAAEFNIVVFGVYFYKWFEGGVAFNGEDDDAHIRKAEG